MMSDDEALHWLLALNGARFEDEGYIIEMKVERTDPTPQRPHGISYALVLRPSDGGAPWLRFDNAHAIKRRRRSYAKVSPAYDHWHRDQRDEGRAYTFTSAEALLEDFWREVERVLKEKGFRS